MTYRETHPALTILKLLLIGLAVVVLFRLAFFIGGVVLAGATAAFGVGVALLLVVGVLVVFFTLMIAPFVFVGWLAIKGWQYLREEREGV